MPRRKKAAFIVVAAAVVGTIGSIYGCGGRYAHGQVYSLIRYAHADVDDLGCTMSALSRYGYCTFRAKPQAVTQLVQSLDLIPYNAKHDRPAQNGDLLSILFGKDPSDKALRRASLLETAVRHHTASQRHLRRPTLRSVVDRSRCVRSRRL